MTNLNLSQLTDRLKQWSAKAVNDYSARSIYLFGSLIHKEGQQFSRNSDIDLVVVMPQLDDALARHRWLESFSEHKEALEIQLMRLLGRLAAEPSASIVAVTDTELAFDIHKDGHRQFFTANTFRNLSTDANTTGIPGAGRASPDRCVAVALAFAQKIRNEYFAVSANGTSTLIAYEGPDPLPKQIMRAAAMAARAIGKTNGPGAEYDVQEGLDLLFNHLYTDRNRASALSELQDLVSVRRNARGQYRPVDPTHQLLLAELIFDLATSVGVNAVPPPLSSAPSVSVGEANEIAGESEPKTFDAKQTSNAKISDEAPRVERTPMPFGSTPAFFAERFASAFPGVRSTTWYDDSNEIATRLLMLLKAPLSFSDRIPIWWWRGGNLHIERFEQLEPDVFIMNVEELKISRIAAVPGSTYRRNFVYVQTDAMSPTGLYPLRPGKRATAVQREEYGLFAGKTLLTRGEYDDGHKMIDGKLVNTVGQSELRLRYLSPYNFLLASNGSPINNPKFDHELEKELNAALKGSAERALKRIEAGVNSLPIKDSY